jgi:hypothetical protein
MSQKYIDENLERREGRTKPVPNQVRWPNSRNVRKWCKGKVGVLHVYEWQCSDPRLADDPTWKYERQVCINCGRKYKLRKRP